MQEEQFGDSTTTSLEKTIYVTDLQARDVVHSSFLVKSKRLPLNRNGKAYLALNLMDKTGEIEGRVWENVESQADLFEEGDVVVVGGKVNLYQNRKQLIVQHLSSVSTDEVNLLHYLPCSNANLDAYYEELIEIFKAFENPWIRQVALSLLEDPEIAKRFKVCPAGKSVHHAYIGGLLCHSLQMVKIADRVLSFYPDVNREIALFGAAFHDFGKIFELSYAGDFGYTDEGRLVGHITIAANLIDRKILEIKDFPDELNFQLKHLILSHHGRLEYGSPKKPATLEAQLVTSLDELDSKIDSITDFIKKDSNPSNWTSLHRAYDQYYFKPVHLRKPIENKPQDS